MVPVVRPFVLFAPQGQEERPDQPGPAGAPPTGASASSSSSADISRSLLSGTRPRCVRSSASPSRPSPLRPEVLGPLAGRYGGPRLRVGGAGQFLGNGPLPVVWQRPHRHPVRRRAPTGPLPLAPFADIAAEVSGGRFEDLSGKNEPPRPD